MFITYIHAQLMPAFNVTCTSQGDQNLYTFILILYLMLISNVEYAWIVLGTDGSPLLWLDYP